MAKKTTKKTTDKKSESTEQLIINNEIVENSQIIETNKYSLICEGSSNCEYKPSLKYMSPMELQANESLIRMLVIYYEKLLRLDEVEGRPVMSENRNMFTRLTTLHNKILKYIENKVLDLENYEWE